MQPADAGGKITSMTTNTDTLTAAEQAALARVLELGQLAASDAYHVVLCHDTSGDDTAGRVYVAASGRRYISVDAETAITLREVPIVAEPDGYLLQLTLVDLECAAHAWSAACSTAGAAAPRHIADALIASGGDIIRAALDGTRAALEEHEGHTRDGWGGPAPRGLDVAVRGGQVIWLIWSTETSEVRIGGRPGAWHLHVATVGRSHPRIRATIEAAWSWREPGDRNAIVAAAMLAGITVEQLEAADALVEPPPGWEDRAVDRTHREGVL